MMMIKQLVLADQIQVEATCGAHRKYYQSKLDQVWISSILLTCTTYCLHLNLIHLHLTHCYGHNDVNLITGIVPIFVRWRINILKKVLVAMGRKHAASSYLSSSVVLNKRCSYPCIEVAWGGRRYCYTLAVAPYQQPQPRATDRPKTRAAASLFPSSDSVE